MSEMASKYLQFRKTNLRELSGDDMHRNAAIDRDNQANSVVLPCTHEGCYTTLALTCLCASPG